MDINKQTNIQHKTIDISPYLRKAQWIFMGPDSKRQYFTVDGPKC